MLIVPGTRDDDVPTTRSNLPLPWPSNSGPRFAGLGVVADDHVQLNAPLHTKTLPSPDRWPAGSATPLGGGVGGCRGPDPVPGTCGGGITGLPVPGTSFKLGRY